MIYWKYGAFNGEKQIKVLFQKLGPTLSPDISSTPKNVEHIDVYQKEERRGGDRAEYILVAHKEGGQQKTIDFNQLYRGVGVASIEIESALAAMAPKYREQRGRTKRRKGEER